MSIVKATERHFYYFAFGSNLYSKRIRLKNPTATQITIGKLLNYKLGFKDLQETAWGGAPATIIEDTNSHVWGVVWRLSQFDLENLDAQEGAPHIYNRMAVNVKGIKGIDYECYTYYLANYIDGPGLPSLLYLKVILKGAKENKLPEDYISNLQSIEHNGCIVHPRSPLMMEDLE